MISRIWRRRWKFDVYTRTNICTSGIVQERFSISQCDILKSEYKFFATIRNSSFDTRTNPRTYDNNSSIAETNSRTRKTIYNLTIEYF